MAITQLTTNGTSKTPDISGNNIVWVNNNSDVILFDGTTSTVLPDLGLSSITSPQISADGILWKGYISGWQIFSYNGTSTTQLTNEPYIYDQKLSGNRVAWRSAPEYSPGGALYEVFVYDYITQTTVPLTSNNTGEYSVDISGSNVVWRGGGGNNIFLHDGVSTTQLTSNGVSPHVSGNQVVWRAYSGGQLSEIYLYDGSTTSQLVDSNNSVWLHGFFDGNVVWSEWDGNDWELFRFDGTNTSQITNNDFNDVLTPSSTATSSSVNSSAAVDGSGDNLVWSSYVGDSWEVFFFDGTQTIQVTDNSIDDLNPKISGNTVVWSTSGTTSDIFMFEPDPNPDPSPVTFEDDFAPDIDNSQWQEISNGIVNSNFGGGGNSLFFSGGSSGGNVRFATSQALDLTAGGFITFDLIFGTSSNGGENADAGEDVVLEYSIDGTAWTELALYDTEDYTSWSTLIEAIPAAAQTAATLLRWRQINHSGYDFDNWGLDNVSLEDAETNFAPSGIDATFNLAENSSNGTVVGTVVASDPNPDQVLSYSIQSGNDAGAFAIDSTGQLTVIDSTSLDYETTPSFNLVIEVSDDGSPSLSDTVLIDVDLVDIHEGTTFIVVADYFEPNIDNSQWSNVGNSSINNNFGGSGNSLFFTGGNYRDSSRYITTNGINVANGGEISFDLIFGTSSNGGENADAGEDVVLEYSTDNGINWVEIGLYDTEAYTSWTGISESIPAGAQTDNTEFRWLQVAHSGSGFDNWGLDNILIEAF